MIVDTRLRPSVSTPGSWRWSPLLVQPVDIPQPIELAQFALDGRARAADGREPDGEPRSPSWLRFFRVSS